MPKREEITPVECEEGAPENAPSSLNRRDGLKLVAGIVALATGLGMPRRTLGLEPNAARIAIKFYRGAQDGGELLDTAQLSDGLAEYLASAAGARLQLKFYDKSAGELGSMPISARIQEKVQRLQNKVN